MLTALLFLVIYITIRNERRKGNNKPLDWAVTDEQFKTAATMYFITGGVDNV
jgi:hypothetical protein